MDTGDGSLCFSAEHREPSPVSPEQAERPRAGDAGSAELVIDEKRVGHIGLHNDNVLTTNEI